MLGSYLKRPTSVLILSVVISTITCVALNKRVCEPSSFVSALNFSKFTVPEVLPNAALISVFSDKVILLTSTGGLSSKFTDARNSALDNA